MNFSTAHSAIRSIANNISQLIHGQDEKIKLLVCSFLCGGHVLLEDVPGTGKTTLAKAFARSIDLHFQRIQFTPDLLPSDILGVNIFDPSSHDFILHRGPVFTDILLADEINRASPRTQSALLEAMAEGHVTLDRDQHPLNDFFFVVATQNNIDSHGTYPLPEAQMDRFSLKFSLGYISRKEEIQILSDITSLANIESLSPCVTREDVVLLRKHCSDIRISDDLKGYIVDIIAATRSAEHVQLGASPRASITLMKVAKALALFEGSEFVTPDHIKQVCIPAISHRLSIAPQATFNGITAETVVSDILNSTQAPG